MASHREVVNPLRPYYTPPSIGEPRDAGPGPSAAPLPLGNATGKYASRTRNIFSDIDYKHYIAEPSPSAIKTVTDLVDELVWQYASVLMAQPFEVAKTLLQVRSQDDLGGLAAAAAEAATRKKLANRSGSCDQVGGRFAASTAVSLTVLAIWRLRLRRGRTGLFYFECSKHSDPLISPITATEDAVTTGISLSHVETIHSDDPAELAKAGLDPRCDFAAMADGGRVGGVEGCERVVSLYGSSVADGELVPEFAERHVQRA